MPSLEIILSAFLAISLTASIISSKARVPYTIILVLFGVAIAGSSLSSILGVSLLYDSLLGGGLFVGLVLPPLLFETTMNIRFEEFRAVARPALRLATVGVVIATAVGGGVIVGLLVALGAHFLSRLVTDPMSETMITITTVYGSYTVASALGFSGIVAVAIAGLYYGNSTVRTWVLPQTTRTVRNFWRITAFIANSLAFLYIGLSTDLARIQADLLPIGLAFTAVTIARFSSVYPLLGTSKINGEPIPRAWKNVAILGGMRGSLSIALVASLPATIPSRDVITSMVLGVAFTSIILQGPLLSSYVSRKFPRKVEVRPLSRNF